MFVDNFMLLFFFRILINDISTNAYIIGVRFKLSRVCFFPKLCLHKSGNVMRAQMVVIRYNSDHGSQTITGYLNTYVHSHTNP